MRHPATLGKATKDQRRRFLVAGFLTLLAACLTVGLLAFIVLEAFNGDLDLWPFGTENFTIAPTDQPVTGGQLVGAFSALNAIQCFVITAGVLLVLRHRARSALATDSPCISVAFNVAEPWGRN
jgi:hypothetical protein